jgi:hypothetical protein
MTAEEFMEQCRVSLANPGRLVPPNPRKSLPSHWLYDFVIQAGDLEHYYPISLPDGTPEDTRDELAQQTFKETAALLARKIAEWVDQGG